MLSSPSRSRTIDPPPASHGGGGDVNGGGDDGGGGGGGGGGKLVKVAFARNQPEGEMMQGLLLESGIPSVLKRSRGFDAPEFLAGGPREVFVEVGVAERARQLLADTVIESESEEVAELRGEGGLAATGGETSPGRLALWLLAALLFAIALVWALYQLS